MIKKTDKLKDYNDKRNLEKSPEPNDDKNKSNKKPIFVIQKHNARNLHYDFRLESDKVLKSWVIPKGPSTNPNTKRLAVPTEDHPLDYADFEGKIPKGQYGAGEVIVWDTGTYKNTSKKNGTSLSIDEAIKKGHVTVDLNGKKLQGEYALIKTGNNNDDNWLFIKMKDSKADKEKNPVKSQPESVKSGKRIKELKRDDD